MREAFARHHVQLEDFPEPKAAAAEGHVVAVLGTADGVVMVAVRNRTRSFKPLAADYCVGSCAEPSTIETANVEVSVFDRGSRPGAFGRARAALLDLTGH